MTPICDAVAEAFHAIGEDLTVMWRRSAKGALSGWCDLDGATLLLSLAEALSALDARLSAVTGYLNSLDQERGAREVAYHFDLDGATLTLTVTLPLEGASVPSLAALFRNAQWCERELMELYLVAVTDHPDPRRLFLDESLEPAVLERLIPYSSFINGASSKNLFESVLREKEKETPP